jgi:hypothetical protein
MKTIFSLRGRRLAIATLAIFAVAGGVAYAAILDASDVYHACLSTSGSIRIIDPDADQCKANETAITFNQSGHKGDPGSPSAQGPPGVNGTNGARGPAGADGTSPTVAQLGPDDPNSISVTHDGVTIAQTGGSLIRLASDTIRVFSNATATVESSGSLTVKGSLASINGSAASCLPAARLGDTILGSGGGMFGAVVGNITSGSLSVCIGS